jgi:hypothetical protein
MYFPESSPMLMLLLDVCAKKVLTPIWPNGHPPWLFLWNEIHDYIQSAGLQLDVLKPPAVHWATNHDKVFQSAAYDELIPQALAAFGTDQVAKLAFTITFSTRPLHFPQGHLLVINQLVRRG